MILTLVAPFKKINNLMKIFEYTSIAFALITVILAIFFDRLDMGIQNSEKFNGVVVTFPPVKCEFLKS
ncbi:MAG: hypothetical protein ACI9SQ_002165 [Rubritalea sp.]